MIRSVTAFVGIVLISLVACAGRTSPIDTAPVEIPKSAKVATFGGGCFWCMEPPFEKLKGVYTVVSGYSGGKEVNPTYNEVAGGRTGHTEVVQVTYDPAQITYDALVEVFWRSMDPTDSGGQFADRGSQYRPAIFTHGPEQAATARASRDTLEARKVFNKPIVVEITPFSSFYAAESYHQDYYKKKPRRYEAYRRGSGRAAFLERVWGKI